MKLLPCIALGGNNVENSQDNYNYYSNKYPNISIRGAKYMAARSLPLEISDIVDVYIYKR